MKQPNLWCGLRFGLIARRVGTVFLLFCYLPYLATNTHAADIVVDPTNSIPETIDELISAINESSPVTSISDALENNNDGDGDDNTPFVSRFDAIDAANLLFDPSYLQRHKEYFLSEADFLGVPDEIDRFAFKMFEQWLYLEVYRVRRLEFLLINYAKTLYLSDLSFAEAEKRFRSAIPQNTIAHSPLLIAEYESLLEQFTSADENERTIAKDYTKGLLESTYLAQAAIGLKKELLGKRYREGDDPYDQGILALEQKEEMIRHSSALLETNSFKSLVAPYVQSEALPTQMQMESAINSYLKDLHAFLDEKRTIVDLYNYVSNSAMLTLNQGFIFALESENATEFRSRINSAFPDGVREILQNIETVIADHCGDIQGFSTAQYVSISNANTTVDISLYRKWLERIFQEQALHWIISEEFPYLQTASEGLSNFVAEELRAQKLKRLQQLSFATALFAVSPLGRMGNRTSKWMGPTLLKFWKSMNLSLKAGLVGMLSYDTYMQYREWQRIRRLSRTNIEGTGLTSLVQAEGAFNSLVLHGLLTGGTLALSLKTSSGFWSRVNRSQKANNRLLKAFHRTWNNDPIALAAIRRNSNRHWQEFMTAMQSLKLKVATNHALSMGANIGAVFTQFITMVPAHMPRWIRGFMSSIPVQVYNGVTLGTVMGVMGVTVQSYITAGGLKAFVWGFEKIGFSPPAYWQQNALNQADRLKRDASLSIERDLGIARQEIAKLLGMQTMWRRMLETDDDLGSLDIANLEAAISGADESIKNLLQLNLLRWYRYFEVRDLQNSLMKEKGFGILASPNYDDPVRITIFIKIGDKTIAHAMTVKEIQNIFDRDEIPDLGLERNELQKLAEQLGL